MMRIKVVIMEMGEKGINIYVGNRDSDLLAA